MRIIIIGIIIVGLACWLVVKKNELKAYKADVTSSRTLAVSYADQTKIAEDGLKNLAGKDGVVKWSNSEITNSSGQDMADVEAFVTGIDSKGQQHTASFIFYVNHTTKKYMLERVLLDGKLTDLKEGYKLIVTGSFGS